MTDLTESEYESEVETYAEYLLDAAREDYPENPENANLADLAVDVLDAHHWFTRSHYGPAWHGAIVEYSDADPYQYRDLEGYVSGKDPEEIFKTVAFACFETDVLETARDQLEVGQ